MSVGVWENDYIDCVNFGFIKIIYFLNIKQDLIEKSELEKIVFREECIQRIEWIIIVYLVF